MIPLFKVFVAPEAKPMVDETLSSGHPRKGRRSMHSSSFFASILRRTREFAPSILCTSAIHLAMYLIKREYALPDGAEAISSPLTRAATNFPVVANRLAIRWADVNPHNLNIDLTDVERKLTANTRILLFVHWGGYPIDYAALGEIATRYRRRFGHELIVVEDCAHAWESHYHGAPVGAVQKNFACFSFQAIKAPTTSDGGLLLAPNDDLCRQARLGAGLASIATTNSISGSQDIAEWGFKFHMNDVAASIGLANYPYVRDLVAKHKENARVYHDELRGVSGVTLPERRDGFDSSNSSCLQSWSRIAKTLFGRWRAQASKSTKSTLEMNNMR